MTTILSERALKLGESETLAMSRRANELKAKGVDVINLSLGEPDFYTPDFVKDAAKKAIDNNNSFYTPVAGNLDLRDAISQKLKRENDLNFPAGQIVVSAGAKQSIANVLISLLNPGDEVVLPSPYWVSYKEIIEFAGGTAVIVTAGAEQDYKITPQQLKSALSSRTKAFLFSNPSNPTGSVYSKDELQAFVKVLTAVPSAIVISDEIYEYITFGVEPVSIGIFPEVKERTVIVNGFSKGYAMTGWRLGYLAGPSEITKACEKIQSQFTSGANSIAQKAAVGAAIAGNKDPSVVAMRSAFEKRRNVFYEELKKIPEIIIPLPQGAFYLFPDVRFYLGKKYKDQVMATSKQLAMYLLDVAHVGITAGEAFGAPTCLRLSYAINEEKLKDAASRIKKALLQLE